MEAVKLRERLMQEVSHADENLLKVLEEVIENYNSIPGGYVSEPMDIEQYNKALDLAEDDIANGNVFTHEEVGEIIRRWGRK